MPSYIIKTSNVNQAGTESSDTFTVESGVNIKINASTGIDVITINVSGIVDISSYDKLNSRTEITSTGISSGEFISLESISVVGSSGDDAIRVLGENIHPNLYVNGGKGTDRLVLPYTHFGTETFYINKSVNQNQTAQMLIGSNAGSFTAELFEEIQLNDGYYTNSTMRRNLSIDIDILSSLKKVLGTKYNDDHLKINANSSQYLWMDDGIARIGFQNNSNIVTIENVEYIEFSSSTLYVPTGELVSVPYETGNLYGIGPLQFAANPGVKIVQISGLNFEKFISMSLDTAKPTISVLTEKISLKYGEATTILFNFSEQVADFTASDLTVSGGTITNFTGSGTSYTATFTPTANSTANGIIGVASGKFSDAAGNFNADGADANNTVSIAVDTVLPTITFSASKTSLKAGETATISFTLSAPSTDFTASDLTVSGGTITNFAGSGSNYTATFAPTANASGSASISVASGMFSDAAGSFNADGADANNTVTLSIISTRLSLLTVLVDKGVLGTEPMLLKNLDEVVTTTGTTVTAHTVDYSGIKFNYDDVDALITTVIRDGNFTDEFREEITDQYPTLSNISYSDAVGFVGAVNIDGVLISVAGADGNYVG